MTSKFTVFAILAHFSVMGQGIDSTLVFRNLLGRFPVAPELMLDTLEATDIHGGQRLKIRYLSEAANATFAEPRDFIDAYLFVPYAARETKLPAIVAIHQDGSNLHLGKLEPAGLSGKSDQHYGLELFQRGYVVICPDRFYHAERRRIADNDSTNVDVERDLKLAEFRTGQLLLKGRTTPGKMAYDLSRAVDVLRQYKFVDRDNIGAIGHSGGGMALLYFMAMDDRVKAGVSSCGIFDIVDYFAEEAPTRTPLVFAIPELARYGDNGDYLGLIAPRPMLLTRGLHEFGKGTPEKEAKSKEHVNSTKRMVETAEEYYADHNATSNLRTIYFDDEGGKHSFPPSIRKNVYQWLDMHLKFK